LGFGDLAKSLYPLLLPFTKDINVYDPWIPKKKIKQFGFNSMSLNEMFKKCEIIYVLAAVTTKNKNLIDKKLLNKMKSNSLFILMSRAAVVNFKDLIKRVKKGDIFVATDVFPEEPVSKKDQIRKIKNILFSAHRAGALKTAFFNMGNIVLKDMNLISKNFQPKFCKIAQPKTVGLLASKPVAIN
jgi:phosphoglycerate dehydrogenase-like enzyme